MKHPFTILIVSVGIAILSNGLAAQQYPSKPIRMVASNVGGGEDFHVRLLAPVLSELLGQRMIIENQKNNSFAYEVVRKAAPDGYTILIAGSNLWLEHVFTKTPWDADKDYVPITMATNQPNVVVVNASSPIRSVGELIALAKSKPGALNYPTGATRGSNHIATELFKSMAGVDIVRIPYKGSGGATQGLVAGEVDVMFGTAASVASLVKAGRLRSIAVTSSEPSELLPGLPAVSATVPGYESTSYKGMFAPAKTPATIVQRLNRAFVLALNNREVKEQFNSAGLDIVASTPPQATVIMRSELARILKMIKEGGVQFDD